MIVSSSTAGTSTSKKQYTNINESESVARGGGEVKQYHYDNTTMMSAY